MKDTEQYTGLTRKLFLESNIVRRLPALVSKSNLKVGLEIPLCGPHPPDGTQVVEDRRRYRFAGCGSRAAWGASDLAATLARISHT